MGFKTIDYRTDADTRVTPAMLDRIRNSEFGVDLFRNDASTTLLERTVADRVGKAAAVFAPSGVMANQLALLSLVPEGGRALAGGASHIGLIERHAPFRQVDVVADPDLATYSAAVRESFASSAPIDVIAIENTHMAAGGRAYTPAAYDDLRDLNVPIHLDGARLGNAAAATGFSMLDLAQVATTVMVTLSKGFGAPVGSILAGPADIIEAARAHRLDIGGTLPKPGLLAAAALVAIERPAEEFRRDHAKAERIRQAAEERWPGSVLERAHQTTNLVVLQAQRPNELCVALEAEGILALPFGTSAVRFAIHGGLSDADIDRTVEVVSNLPYSSPLP